MYCALLACQGECPLCKVARKVNDTPDYTGKWTVGRYGPPHMNRFEIQETISLRAGGGSKPVTVVNGIVEAYTAAANHNDVHA